MQAFVKIFTSKLAIENLPKDTCVLNSCNLRINWIHESGISKRKRHYLLF